MKIIDCIQQSPEWWQARRGIPTASEFSRIITPKKMELSAAADGYICELIGDLHRLTPPEPFQRAPSRAIQNGIDTEPEARNWYSLEHGCDVQQVGFCLMDDGRFGCSPDGLIDAQGGLELKCPEPKTQVEYLLAGTLPDAYKAQVHGSLIVTGRAWWDFMSYCPGLKPFLVRVTQDKYTEALRAALEVFWTRYQELLEKVKAM